MKVTDTDPKMKNASVIQFTCIWLHRNHFHKRTSLSEYLNQTTTALLNETLTSIFFFNKNYIVIKQLEIDIKSLIPSFNTPNIKISKTVFTK